MFHFTRRAQALCTLVLLLVAVFQTFILFVILVGI